MKCAAGYQSGQLLPSTADVDLFVPHNQQDVGSVQFGLFVFFLIAMFF